MAAVKRFEDLEVWKASRRIVRDFNLLVNSSKLVHDKILTYQMRRAAISVFANIAEGFERNGNKEFVNFLFIAKASNGEFRTLLYAAVDIELITQEEFDDFYKRSCLLSGSLFSLISHLKKSEIKGVR